MTDKAQTFPESEFEEYASLIISNTWTDKRRAQAKAVLRSFGEKMFRAGAAAGNVVTHRQSHGAALEMAALCVRSIDPGLAALHPNLPAEEASLLVAARMLEELKDGSDREAA